MSNLTNKQIQQILDGAPEGATHYDGCNYLRSEDKSFVFSDWDDEARIWCAYYEPSGKIQSLSDLGEIITLRQEVERLKLEPPTPNEQGKNRYGLDMAYFRNVINRELNRPLVDFKPDELSRVFARLSKTADKAVMFEPEFSKSHDSEVAARAVEKAVRKYRMRLLDGPDIYSDALIEYANQLRESGDKDE